MLRCAAAGEGPPSPPFWGLIFKTKGTFPLRPPALSDPQRYESYRALIATEPGWDGRELHDENHSDWHVRS